jgi:hypothetical protein
MAGHAGARAIHLSLNEALRPDAGRADFYVIFYILALPVPI